MRSPSELNKIFSDSDYGKTLEASIRFSDFKPVDVDNDTWVGVLGDDVNNLRHMAHTHRIAQRVCRVLGLSPEDTETILPVAMTHDWGEAVITDIALPQKTDEDEVAEERAYRDIAVDLLGQHEGKELSDIVWSVLNKSDTELGDIFRGIEYVGYTTTAMRAGKMGRAIASKLFQLPQLDRPTIERLTGSLLGLEATQVVQSAPTMRQYVEKYPGLQDILSEGVPHTEQAAGLWL